MNYPLRKENETGTLLRPSYALNTEEHVARFNDLYLTTEIRKTENGLQKCYRLHAREPHRMRDYLAYDIQCPDCQQLMKPVDGPVDYHTLGLYACKCSQC